MVRFSDIIKLQSRKTADIGHKDPWDQDDSLSSDDVSSPDNMIERVFAVEPISPDSDAIKPAIYYEKFISKALEVQTRVKGGQNISPSPILSDLHYIIDEGLVDKLYDYVMCGGDHMDFISHGADVTVICLKIGKGMGFDIKALLKLGLAAFLENVGMYRIPDSILNKSKTLDLQEAAFIRKHPGVSHEILSRMGEKYDWLAEIALQVHERSDGSGYPRGLKGTEILEPASIIGLVDSFIAMSKDRPYREKLIRTEAVKSIVEACKGLFPPRIIKAFLNQISPFPVGSYVRLNTGFIGKVTATDKDQPFRPTIELLYDSSGNRLEKLRTISLSEMPMLHIDSVVNPDNMT
jgi:hypothetical protein